MKNVLLSIALLFTFSVTQAQKLPNIQTANLKAPTNTKVDGKATEWGGMQAYNKATEVSYTIANDANNLYLVIQTADPDIIHRIVNGRVTLTINKAGKKSEDNAVAISYPVFEKGNRPGLSLREKLTTSKIADSLMLTNNRRLETTAKLIKVTGVAGLDTLISIYNEKGVKAAATFDNKMLFTCEMAISLKLLDLSNGKFACNIRLNGVSFDDVPGITVGRSADGQITSIDIHKDQMTRTPQVMTAPTDFWGDYMLVQ